MARASRDVLVMPGRGAVKIWLLVMSILSSRMLQKDRHQQGERADTQFDDLPQLEVQVVVNIYTTSCHSPGPSVRNCSSHLGMGRHCLRLVGSSYMGACRLFGEGPRE